MAESNWRDADGSASICLSLLLAQGQLRDRIAVPSDTGVIRGRVYSVATGNPLRHTTVMLLFAPGGREKRDLTAFFGPRTTSGVAMVGPSRTATSDAAGRFEFSSLPANRYHLVVTAGPGRVVDDMGEPVTDATVTAVHLTFGSLGRGPASAAQTDDLGRFRIYGLARIHREYNVD